MKEHKKTKSSGVEVEGLPANALLVDVRSNAEIGVSMIDGAISEQEFKKMTIKDQKAQPIVFYCTIGYRSGLAAKRYAKQGIDAKNLIGGVSAWAFAKKDFVHKKLTTKNVHTYNKEWNYLPTTHTSKVMPQP
jgi:sodium/bile acid cotransporter 7